MGNFIDLAGQRFGRLLVLRRDGYSPSGTQIMWLCVCDCGTQVSIQGNNLRSGLSRSCGCLQREVVDRRNSTHGDSVRGRRSRLYTIWAGMWARCTNSNEECYPHYGGRGISVCPEWKDYATFRAWALENGYAPHLTIDRIDNDRGYAPGNCRWAGAITQANNKSSNVSLLRSDGCEFSTMAKAAKATGCSIQAISNAINGKAKSAGGFSWMRLNSAQAILPDIDFSGDATEMFGGADDRYE